MAKHTVTAIRDPRARSASLRGGALTPHETRIRAMMADDPTLQRKGLGRQIAKYGSHPDRAYEMRTPGFVPDLFSIDFDRLQLRLYEVEGTHYLTPAKIQTIAIFAMELDAHEPWDVRLYAVDVHGTEPRQIDLVAPYLNAARANVPLVSVKSDAEREAMALAIGNFLAWQAGTLDNGSAA